MLGDWGGDRAWGHDEANLERNQLGRESGKALELSLGIAVFNHKVTTLNVTEVAQSLKEGPLQVEAPSLRTCFHSALGSDPPPSGFVLEA